ncbi:MAG: flavodoxin family protein [Candidatus Delongbacteria bacterium]|nr:flavodoxin family protein [Candidatus Delongbacteria bacterium]
MKVVAFNGSPRSNGNTSILLRTVLQELDKEGIETETISLGGFQIRGCAGCRLCQTRKNLKCVFDDDIINRCVETMIAADGIIIGSPVYFSDITSETKALIDRCGSVCRAANVLKYKIGAAVIAVRRGGAIHAFDSINHFFLINQMIIPGSSYWNIGIGRDVGDVERDQEGIQAMSVLGQNMAWLLKRIKSN